MKAIKKIGGIIINNKKMLVVRKRGTDVFIFPGGKVEGTESSEQTLMRELMEELGIEVFNFRYLGTFIEPAALERNTEVELEIYFVDTRGEFVPKSEIKEYRWIDSSYKNKGIRLGSVLGKHTIPKLLEKGLIE
ncbi:MAG: NUDIX domain-containing protein [Candidatus Aenigmarchaeota archaeon]|nr:NUDIX domain-containing protein [Candidatus Aenigmarchaeota archaeon]